MALNIYKEVYMEFIKGQVKVLANVGTQREVCVNLEDIVLNPASDNHVTLGRYLENLSDEIKGIKEENKKIKNALKSLIGVNEKMNLK